MGSVLRADVDPGLGEGPRAPAADLWPPTRIWDLGGYAWVSAGCLRKSGRWRAAALPRKPDSASLGVEVVSQTRPWKGVPCPGCLLPRAFE